MVRLHQNQRHLNEASRTRWTTSRRDHRYLQSNVLLLIRHGRTCSALSLRSIHQFLQQPHKQSLQTHQIGVKSTSNLEFRPLLPNPNGLRLRPVLYLHPLHNRQINTKPWIQNRSQHHHDLSLPHRYATHSTQNSHLPQRTTNHLTILTNPLLYRTFFIPRSSSHHHPTHRSRRLRIPHRKQNTILYQNSHTSTNQQTNIVQIIHTQSHQSHLSSHETHMLSSTHHLCLLLHLFSHRYQSTISTRILVFNRTSLAHWLPKLTGNWSLW